MAATEIIDQVLEQNALRKQGVAKTQEQEKKQQKQQIDALLLAYMYIFESVQIGHNTAYIQAKQVEANAVVQEKMIRQESGINFIEFRPSQLKHDYFSGAIELKNGYMRGFSFYANTDPTLAAKIERWEKDGDIARGVVHTQERSKKVGATQLENLETNNQQISAVRNIMEDKLTVLRQNAQIGETDLNTAINSDEQSIQQGGSLMQMLVNLTNQVSRI